mgnify:CR=1 FL=1
MVVLALQGVAAFHCIRRGTQQRWIWVIVFLPLVGSLAYIFTEMIRPGQMQSAQSGLANLLNPGGRIKKLEQNFSFSGTFANRIALADAYLDAAQYNKAIELYEPVLQGNVFDNSDGAIKNLIQAYYKTGRYADVVKVAPRVINSLDFAKTPANLYYAQALEEVNRPDDAETEYKKMNQRFCNYQQRYYYSSFLLRHNRAADARTILETILTEAQHLSGREKSAASEWIGKAKQELKKLQATTV